MSEFGALDAMKEIHLERLVRQNRWFVEQLPEIIAVGADRAILENESDRDFGVSATAVVAVGIQDEPLAVDGVNVKRRPKNLLDVDVRMCAEADALVQVDADIDKLEVERIIGLAVVADSNPGEIKDSTGIEVETLIPCRSCTETLSANPLLNNNSPVVTADLDYGAFQVFSPKRLMRMYSERWNPADQKLISTDEESMDKILESFDRLVRFYDFSNPNKTGRTTIGTLTRAALYSGHEFDR